MGISRTIRRFLADERGTETTEWALIIGLLAVGAIALLISIGGWAANVYAKISGDLESAP